MVRVERVVIVERLMRIARMRVANLIVANASECYTSTKMKKAELFLITGWL